jgi:alpha-tubulin suppressor-like RCC1 family protein
MTTITTPGPFMDIDAGHAHTCAVKTSGETWCWGWNAFHQLGANALITECAQNVPCSPQPQRLTGLPRVISVRAGFAFTCALTVDGGTWCWGLGVDGQLGTGARTSSGVPVAVTGGLRFLAVDAGAAHACGITESGEAWCWGEPQWAVGRWHTRRPFGTGSCHDRGQPDHAIERRRIAHVRSFQRWADRVLGFSR